MSLTGGRWSFRTWRTEKHALPEFRADAIDTEQCATQSLRPKGDSRCTETERGPAWTGVGELLGPWKQPMDSPYGQGQPGTCWEQKQPSSRCFTCSNVARFELESTSPVIGPVSRLSSLPTHGTQSPAVRRMLPPRCTPACDCWTGAIGASRRSIDGRLSALSARGDVHIPSLTLQLSPICFTTPPFEGSMFHSFLIFP